MLLTIMLNCASEAANLPVFEASHVPGTMITFAHHPTLEVAILGKIILSFLVPILTNEQYAIVKLTQEEGSHLISELSETVTSSDAQTDDHSLLESLTFLLNFTKPIGAISLQENSGQQERKGSNFLINFKQRLKVSASNIQTLVSLGIIKILESLIVKGATIGSITIEMCLRLLWNLLHDEATVKLISPLVSTVLASIHFEVSNSAKSLILCIQWLLGNVIKSGELLLQRLVTT